MPRKGKRSEAQKQRRKVEASLCINSVSSASDVSPDVLSVTASHCQSDPRYAIYSRGQQCTCNSLMFLAVHNERNELNSLELDDILKKGDALYTLVKQTLQSKGQFRSNFLDFDELPDKLETNLCSYNIIKHGQRFGLLRDAPALGSYDNLENTLQCLRSEISNCLFLCGLYCVALFRDRSGRFGFFDSHCRTPDGMSTNDGTGTAVMLTFSRLEDMIERLLLLFQGCFQLSDNVQFDLLPVSFTSTTVCTDVSMEYLDNIEPCVASQFLSTNDQCASSQQQIQVRNPVQCPVNITDEDEMEIQTTVTDNLDRDKNVQLNTLSHNISKDSSIQIILSDPNDHCLETSDLNQQSKKLNKSRRRKDYKIKWHKKIDLKDRKQTKKTEHYKTSTEYKKRHNQAMKNRYQTNTFYREEHKQAMKNKYKKSEEYKNKRRIYAIMNYRNNEKYREKKKRKIISSYSSNAKFRERQKTYVIRNYRMDEHFRERQKTYVIRNYRMDEHFRERQKTYVIRNYRNSDKLKEKQKRYITDRYSRDAIFRQRLKDYYKNRCKIDSNFYEQRKVMFKKRYQHDSLFRARQKAYNLFKAKDGISALKIIHKINCAQDIQHKYKVIDSVRQATQVFRHNQPVEIQNPVILKALQTFRDIIKQGPTYICTCCARALFSNQVRTCDRESYQKNPTVVSLCLTGNYVHICSDCTDHCMRNTEWICHSCHSTLLRGTMPDIAVANKLQFSPIPPELCNLNILERHVIAKYIPFAKILTLPKGQQRAIKGAVISVASEVETTVNCLPRPRSESQLLTVKLKRRLCYQGHYQYQTMNMHKVLSALAKLKDMHSEYKNIVINDSSAHDEPMDIDNSSQSENTERQSNENEHDNSSDDPESNNEQHSGLVLDTCLQPPDLGQHLLSYDDGIFCIAPAEKNSPVSIFKIPKLESMAFPVQFPDGKNTFDEPDRVKCVSPSRYFNTRLFSVDNRCAKDTNYIFFAQFVTEMHMATSSMSIQLRKAKPMTRDGRRINCSLLQDKSELEKLVHNKEATRFMQPLRGTPAYWEKTLRDLFSMLRQLGTPTFFCTFSAAEMRWPEVITAIKAQQGETVNFSELDWSEKCDILKSNPVTAMRMFEKRVEALIRDLIMSPAQPIGEVIDFFYRVEFQQRGSPHIHCLFWVKDSPEFEKDQDEDVCNFIDKYISCKLPDPNKDPELHRIVSEVQMHSRNHSKSCRKNNKHCRFGFPKPPMNTTMITRPRPPPIDQSDEENEATEERENDSTAQAKAQLQKVWDLLNDTTQSFETTAQLLQKVNMTYEEYKEIFSMSVNIKCNCHGETTT
nr:uncharacterized protein LOC129419814 [Misgurnus anguillicaudatus]